MKKVILILLFLGFAQISVAAQPTMAKAAGQLLKKAFSGTMTGLHWGIAAGIPMGLGTVYTIELLSNKSAFFPDSNHSTTYFIATELLQQGVKIDSVKIFPMSDDFPPMISPIQQTVCISPSAEKEITTALENDDKLTQQKYKSTLEHTTKYIERNIHEWIITGLFTMPLITHAATKSLYSNLAYAKKAKPFLLQQCSKIPTGFGKLALSMGAINGFLKYQDQRIDNEMTNDVDTLTGLRTYLTDLNKHRILPYPLDTTEKRIQKLDRRIALLEKTQENESNNS